MKKPAKYLSIILCTLILTGCWDTTEPERLVYTTGIGIDYKDGKIVVFLQIVNMSGLAKTEGGSSVPNRVDVGRATGKTIDEAIFNLYHTSDRRIYWGHLSFIIFSENALKHDLLRPATDFLDRYRETRYRIFYYATKESLKDTMTIGPIESVSMAFSKLSDPEGNFKQSSLIQPLDLREIIIKLDEPSHVAALPVIKITKQWFGEKEARKNLLIEDVAVVSKNKYYGIFPKDKIGGTRLISKEFTRDNIDLFKGTDKVITAVVYDKKEKIIPIVKGDEVKFKIKLKLKANIELVKQSTKMKDFEKEIKKVLKTEIKTSYKYGASKGVDVFHLSEVLYRKHNKTWKKIEKDGRIPLTKDLIESIEINVTLQNSGKDKLTPVFE